MSTTIAATEEKPEVKALKNILSKFLSYEGEYRYENEEVKYNKSKDTYEFFHRDIDLRVIDRQVDHLLKLNPKFNDKEREHYLQKHLLDHDVKRDKKSGELSVIRSYEFKNHPVIDRMTVEDYETYAGAGPMGGPIETKGCTFKLKVPVKDAIKIIASKAIDDLHQSIQPDIQEYESLAKEAGVKIGDSFVEKTARPGGGIKTRK